MDIQGSSCTASFPLLGFQLGTGKLIIADMPEGGRLKGAVCKTVACRAQILGYSACTRSPELDSELRVSEK